LNRSEGGLPPGWLFEMSRSVVLIVLEPCLMFEMELGGLENLFGGLTLLSAFADSLFGQTRFTRPSGYMLFLAVELD
jgi:hypothetical protein